MYVVQRYEDEINQIILPARKETAAVEEKCDLWYKYMGCVCATLLRELR